MLDLICGSAFINRDLLPLHHGSERAAHTRMRRADQRLDGSIAESINVGAREHLSDGSNPYKP